MFPLSCRPYRGLPGSIGYSSSSEGLVRVADPMDVRLLDRD